MAAMKMYTVFRLLSLQGVIAARNDADADDPYNLKGLVGDDVTICGDATIWSDISSPNTAQAIKGIDWKTIDDIMDDYIGDQKLFVEAADSKIQQLTKQIEAKKGMATSRDMTQEEIESLILGAVEWTATEDEKAFGSKEAAVATHCGKPGDLFQDKPPNPMGYFNSVDAIMKVAASFFDEKIKAQDFVEADKKQFTQVCLDFLGFERTGDENRDDLASYCDEMCEEMAKEVQTISDSKSTTKKTNLKKLEAELGKAMGSRQQFATKQNECENAKTRIENYRGYLEGLIREMSTKFKLFQQAEWALADAQAALIKLALALKGQKALVDQANQGLTDLGLAETKAKEDMETAEALLADATYTLDTDTDEWARLVADLEAVRAAETFADEVKQRLSLLLLKMDGFAEECVREPVRNIGLSEETDVYKGNFFSRDVGQLSAKQDVEDQLRTFHKYCEGTAKDVFKLVKDKVDLSPLCDLPQIEETSQEITGAVQQRKGKIVEAIQKVQSWLDPFKGTTVTAQTEGSDFVDAGEPLGLRRVMTLPSTPNSFYSNYLKKWKRKGEFLELLGKIAVAITGLDKKVQEAADKMDKMRQEMERAQSSLDTAIASFQSAADEAQAEKEKFTNTLADLQQKVADAKQSLEDLKRKRDEAKQAWITARDKLLSTHAEATASLTENNAALE